MIVSQSWTSLIGQMVCLSIFGFTFGGYVTSAIVILKKMFEDLGAALGLVLFSAAVASIIGPVIVGNDTTDIHLDKYSLSIFSIFISIGAIYDYWHSYTAGFYIMGGSVLFSASILIFLPLIKRWRYNRDNENGSSLKINICDRNDIKN